MTAIVRWNPFREMAAMQSALDRLFDDSRRAVWPTNLDSTLAFDVYETDDAYTAVVDLPGLTADQINVRMQDGSLTISANLPQPAVPENARLLLQERAFGQFNRTISLPLAVDADHVEATYHDGILTLHLPKTPQAQPKQIAVKSNGQEQLVSRN